MWNDEDNNPYGSYDRRDSFSSSLEDPNSPNQQRNPLDTPTSEDRHASDQRGEDLEDDDQGAIRSSAAHKKEGGYDGRVEQILFEEPDLQILIVDAGKSHENGGSYIVYTIRTGNLEVRRRYSEFASLRNTLVALHPTLVIPPIPEKHSVSDYAAKPTKAKEDISIIDLRKRMLAVFLNRCRCMPDILNDGVWWKFLNPNSSWTEVLHSPPVSLLPKNNLQAPPLDPAHPSPAHQFLPVPSSSAKLKSGGNLSASGTPTTPSTFLASPSAAAHTIPGPQVFMQFPPNAHELSETDLDPYFASFEASTKELERLLEGNVERINRRTLSHLANLSADLMELGGRYNTFSLSESSATLAAALERTGQAMDTSYIATEELCNSLGASFAEPMRESAQFAGVVRAVLRYRILKRIQQEQTRDELMKKKTLLETLERSETEAKRMDQILGQSGTLPPQPTRSKSTASQRDGGQGPDRVRREATEETASVDSDFPPTHGEATSPRPSVAQGKAQGEGDEAEDTNLGSPSKKNGGGNFITNKILGRLSHAVGGVMDADPERSRRDQIGKTRESITHLGEALTASEKDVRDASAGVMKDLKRFQAEKEADLRRYTIAYAKCHIHWAKRNLETWEGASEEIEKIIVR